MASEIQIMNSALIKLGADPITSRSDNKTTAKTLNAIYDQVRDAELRRHRWRFAIARANLPALTTAPVNGIFKYQYQRPSDLLRLLNVGDDFPGLNMADYHGRTAQDYSLEQDKILSNLPAPLAIRYTARITDAGLFDAAFAEALACRLAMISCEKITNSTETRQITMVEYKQAIKEAIGANALENTPERFADDTWVTARAL